MELRELKASDMGAVCSILTQIGVKEFKNCLNGLDTEGKTEAQIGTSVMFDVVGIIIENLPKAQASIDKFLASLTGQKISDIQDLSFADYGELIFEVVTKDDFKDFFKRAMKLFNR